ncbi:TetR/AcrR family transcriptional regulator [Novosphingobium sp. H3SJ31-1]|uniref:TetR/AcrR family transcriptional regulator n=1 Tax=Novosphingobium album (ex Liu et al. 2023) TaxID=3031130 RepID=A0ABT5WW92_9SPHN|nr:TetR/AcrR family transcriptional regulator [Novosphingobium album (ex Liu et al. 2023)]
MNPVRAGRPTREQAEARQAQLLERAFDHFLEKGFDHATIEAIAADVNMTKRTVYARYPDKAALFRAAVRRGIERYAISRERITATRGGDLEQTLIAIAMLRIELTATAEGLRLQRIINTESYRFPDTFNTFYTIAARPTVEFLADLLAEETAAGRLAIDAPLMAANVFMAMVVGGPVRFITSGNPLAPEDVDKRVAFAVRLFLQGARPRG